VAAMVAKTQFLRRQAKKAELMAKAISDIEASQSFSALTKANHGQADLLEKANTTFGKNSRYSTPNP
jgi:hypothetical protein